jgi:hypothetical protein
LNLGLIWLLWQQMCDSIMVAMATNIILAYISITRHKFKNVSLQILIIFHLLNVHTIIKTLYIAKTPRQVPPQVST